MTWRRSVRYWLHICFCRLIYISHWNDFMREDYSPSESFSLRTFFKLHSCSTKLPIFKQPSYLDSSHATPTMSHVQWTSFWNYSNWTEAQRELSKSWVRLVLFRSRHPVQRWRHWQSFSYWRTMARQWCQSYRVRIWRQHRPHNLRIKQL